MSDPSYELQAAVVGALKIAPAVKQIVDTGIFDSVPSKAAFPYISLGDSQVLPDKADCIDGAEVFFQIDGWSRVEGYGEVKKLASAVTAALDDQPIVISGHRVIVFEHQSTQYLRDPDGKTRHAAMTFRALIQPE